MNEVVKTALEIVKPPMMDLVKVVGIEESKASELQKVVEEERTKSEDMKKEVEEEKV